MNFSEMDMLLKKSLKPGRYIHSVNTMKVAVELAQHYGEDVEKAKVQDFCMIVQRILKIMK